nr:hypothetical protein 1 [bacterium]
MVQTLVLDIETAPKLAYVWRFFRENVGAKQVKEHGHVMSYAAKWLGDDNIDYMENRKEDDRAIISSLCSLIDAADMVVAHNGKRFDLPMIRGRALVHGLAPPSPVKVIDTLKIAQREFKFESNSLAYLADALGVDAKESHKKFPGFELWLECLRGNDEAWEEMKKYNIQDILTLEQIYLKMRPWDTRHPNVTVFDTPIGIVCPKCGSDHVHWRGYAHTQSQRYKRYQCQSCGGWGRSRYTVLAKNENLITNQVS